MPKTTEIKTKTLHLTHGQMHLRYTSGKAAPILFLHAVGNSGESFESLINQIEYPAIAPDLFGFGKSSLNDRTRIKAHAQDMVELMDTLKIDDFWVAGNSFGGDIALEIALQIPHRIKGVISLNGGGLTLETPWFFKAMLTAPISSLLFSKLLGPSVWRGYIKSLYQEKKYRTDDFLKKRFSFLKQPGRMAALLKNLIPLHIDRVALHTRIPGFKAPACVIYGENDPEFSIEYGQELAQTLGGKFVKINEAGHFVHEDQPHHVAENISSWINGTLSDSFRSSV